MGEERVYTVNEVVDALDQLDGRTIRIVGMLSIEFEGNAIFHIPQAERRHDLGSHLWAIFDLETLETDQDGLRRFASRHVLITATVDREFKGHMDLSPGSVVIHAIDKHKRR